jgi:DNA-binding HxlR family transcriptional regulator
LRFSVDYVRRAQTFGSGVFREFDFEIKSREDDLSDLEARFTEVEKSAGPPATEPGLTKRIGELERELAQARREAWDGTPPREEYAHRDKVERILSALEGIRHEG